MKSRKESAGRYTIEREGARFALIQAFHRSWNRPGFWNLRQYLPDGTLGHVVGCDTSKRSLLLCLKDGIYNENILKP